MRVPLASILTAALFDTSHCCRHHFFTEKNEIEAAQRFLEGAAADNLIELLKHLSDILANPECSPAVRMQAGLQLKNALYSKDETIRSGYQQRWLQADPLIRQHIKEKVGLDILL